MSTVLLVEDVEPLRASTAAVLRQMGLIVFEAGSAGSATALLAAKRINVLSTDIAIPGGSGEVFAAEAIAHEIVAAHHGSIAVASSPAEGTTFTVRLPRFSAPAGN